MKILMSIGGIQNIEQTPSSESHLKNNWLVLCNLMLLSLCWNFASFIQQPIKYQ